ncbi:hypothetical protein FLL67_03660 [Vibrio cholerae]|nr:hypothetical protein [Vibrio cholerae]EGR2320633.1 hypothetical protein [Vibrio cholerae]EGR2423992.1 hypothetical protein [Vibrio cholerae]TQQ32282.1 hypothetical protein FLL67_03660 [Vibrio cholerae]TXZ57455.1 hypothetical protein FXE56_02885 [Vibrio cholerae]
MEDRKEKFYEVLRSLNQQCLTLEVLYQRRGISNPVYNSKEFAHLPKCATSCNVEQDDSSEGELNVVLFR